MFWSAGYSLLRAEGLDVLNGGLGIGELKFEVLSEKKLIFFILPCIRIGIQPKMLDPDPYQMNTDPKPWSEEIRILPADSYKRRDWQSINQKWTVPSSWRGGRYLRLQTAPKTPPQAPLGLGASSTESNQDGIVINSPETNLQQNGQWVRSTGMGD